MKLPPHAPRVVSCLLTAWLAAQALLASAALVPLATGLALVGPLGLRLAGPGPDERGWVAVVAVSAAVRTGWFTVLMMTVLPVALGRDLRRLAQARGVACLELARVGISSLALALAWRVPGIGQPLFGATLRDDVLLWLPVSLGLSLIGWAVLRPCFAWRGPESARAPQ